MKIAYIEDDLDARDIFVRKLRKESYECEVFDNAEAFLDIAQPGAYDLLLIDIRLPGRTGVHLLKELRARNIFTPAVLITAFSSFEYARDALNSSANYLLEKPFSFTSLLRIIQKILSAPRPLQDCVDRSLATLAMTERENEVAHLMLKGLSNKEIAQMTRLSEKTVKQYVTQIFQKSEVKSRSEFFSWIFPV